MVLKTGASINSSFSHVPEAERQKIVLSEMVRQVGDLGNYVIKATVTIFGAGLFSLLIASRFFSGNVVADMFRATPVLAIFSLAYLSVILSLWWATRCHVKLSLIVDRAAFSSANIRRSNFIVWLLFGGEASRSSGPVITGFFLFLFFYVLIPIAGVFAVSF